MQGNNTSSNQACPLPVIVINQNDMIVSINEFLENLLATRSENLQCKPLAHAFSFEKNIHSSNVFNLKPGEEIYAEFKQNASQVKHVRLIVGAVDNNQLLWLFVSEAQDWQCQYQNKNIEISRLNRAIEGANMGVWEYDISSKQAVFSDKFKRLLDINPEKNLLWQDFIDLIYQADQEIFARLFKEHISSGMPLNFEFRMALGHDVKWLQIKGELFSEKKKPVSAMGSLVDCTHAKQTLCALNDAIESKNIAMEAGKIGLWRAEINADGIWQWSWDDLANEMFGLNPEDKGNLDKWSQTIHPDDLESVTSTLNDSLKTGKVFTKQYRSVLPNGDTRYFTSKGKVGQNILGENCRIDGMCIDQSAIHEVQLELQQLNSQLEAHVEQRTKELQQSKDHAEQANKIKSDFLSMMSHELRTPMNAVIGSLDLLTTTKQTEESMDLLASAKTSALNLVYILNDILDVNKIEAGKLELEDTAFSIAEIIDNVVKVFIPVASKRNINIDVYEDPNIPMFVNGDAMRVRQILFNLIGNAIKFTNSDSDKQGLVRIELGIIESNEFVTNVVFKISDNGIGIDKETQEKLFMPFIQAERSTTRQYGGTGLGLAICGKLTEMMGGRIGLTSAKGQGSCFDVELPFWVSQESKALDVESLSAVRVMLIYFDQSAESRSISFKRFLTDEGAIVSTYFYQEGELLSDSYDVVLMLVNDLSQNQTATEEILKGFADTSKITLSVDNSYIDQAKQLFPSIKVISAQPITRIQLIEIIKNILEKNFGFEELDFELELDGLLDDLDEVIPEKKLKDGVLVVEDNPLNQKIIMKQLNKLGYECDLAEDGEEGKNTWQKGDYKLILTDCHMPNIDGYQMTQIIRDLEREQKRVAIPIIAVTGAAMTGDAERCYDAGMSDFVSKPVLLSDLRAVLKKWYIYE